MTIKLGPDLPEQLKCHELMRDELRSKHIKLESKMFFEHCKEREKLEAEQYKLMLKMRSEHHDLELKKSAEVCALRSMIKEHTQ